MKHCCLLQGNAVMLLTKILMIDFTLKLGSCGAYKAEKILLTLVILTADRHVFFSCEANVSVNSTVNVTLTSITQSFESTPMWDFSELQKGHIFDLYMTNHLVTNQKIHSSSPNYGLLSHFKV